MKLTTRAFTFVELMIVIAIIGILAAVFTPNLMRYYSRGRDVQRISDIRFISQIFQNSARTLGDYPSNTNKDGITSYCISTIRLWDDALPTFRDKQYSQLGGTGSLKTDPSITNPSFGACTESGSYLYAQLQKETTYGVLAARMENQTTGANWTGALLLTNSGYIDNMVQAKPLDKYGDDTDKIFLIISN